MAEKGHGALHELQEEIMISRQVFGIIVLLITGGIVVFLVGLLAIGGLFALILFSPLFIIFSPVLVPLGGFLFLTTAVPLGLGVASIFAISWIYNYVEGRPPVGAEQFHHARLRVLDAASRIKHRAEEYGSTLHGTVQDAASVA
eukprot:c47474_g1_i1 orf=99-530(+)